jgi:hypothetical protein
MQSINVFSSCFLRDILGRFVSSANSRKHVEKRELTEMLADHIFSLPTISIDPICPDGYLRSAFASLRTCGGSVRRGESPDLPVLIRDRALPPVIVTGTRLRLGTRVLLIRRPDRMSQGRTIGSAKPALLVTSALLHAPASIKGGVKVRIL